MDLFFWVVCQLPLLSPGFSHNIFKKPASKLKVPVFLRKITVMLSHLKTESIKGQSTSTNNQAHGPSIPLMEMKNKVFVLLLTFCLWAPTCIMWCLLLCALSLFKITLKSLWGNRAGLIHFILSIKIRRMKWNNQGHKSELMWHLSFLFWNPSSVI